MTAPLPTRLGRYDVVRLLGRGGFGTSYLATADGKQVRVKVPHPHLSADGLAAYRRDAEALADLDTRGVLVPVRAEETADGLLLVSEFVDGETVLAARRGGRLGWDELAAAVATAAEGLHAAHQQGLFHGALKPNNLRVEAGGRVRVLDFGQGGRDQFGRAGPVGPPHYLSPEQAGGEWHRIVDGWSDTFALGAVMYELLTGRHPFAGQTPDEVKHQQATTEPRPPRATDGTLPDGLSHVCERALLQNADRYPSAAALAADLRHWLRRATVFISHSSKDGVFANQLYDALDARGVRCWIAPRHLLPGSDFRVALHEVIPVTPYLLLLVSEASVASGEVDAEIRAAVEHQKTIVPVRLQPVPYPTKLKHYLSAIHYWEADGLSADDLGARLTAVFPVSGVGPQTLTGSVALPPKSVPRPPAAGPPAEAAQLAPKGAMSFGREDAGYFLQLLPGPVGRDGLTDGVRFWKTWAEGRTKSPTSAVGLVYGASGCGKSSRVKAALMPRLEGVVAVYLEASADRTEADLLARLREAVPGLPDEPLADTLKAIRGGAGVPAGGKVVLFLDQFEQWLHAHPNAPADPLALALRQCDGGRLGCALMVRDDFYEAAERFVERDLGLRLQNGVNRRRIDLFTRQHAEHVLALFGRAMDKLPPTDADLSADQRNFLAQAVRRLAENDQVVCVRLSLFADMMQAKEWTTATLRAMDDHGGVGVAFLEETFCSPHAQPDCRRHMQAAQNVLGALLPPEADIKGHSKPVGELRKAAEAADGERFDKLIALLDGELRLITLTGQRAAGDMPAGDDRRYQLTHDFLVPSVREWIRRKRLGTRRGRAEHLLEERAKEWAARPEDHLLPHLLGWANILTHIPRRRWSDPQRQMMWQAGLRHMIRITLAAVVVLLVTVGAVGFGGRVRADALRDRILNAKAADLPPLVTEADRQRAWVDPLLIQARADADARGDKAVQLNTALALLPRDTGQVDFLLDRLPELDPADARAVVDALDGQKGERRETMRERLWREADTPGVRPSARLRTAAALAKYDPKSPRWPQMGEVVAKELVQENPMRVGEWMTAFTPVRRHLVLPLLRTHLPPPPTDDRAAGAEGDARAAEQSARRATAVDLLLHFADDQPRVLVEAMLDADETQFGKFFDALKPRFERGDFDFDWRGFLAREASWPPAAGVNERGEADPEGQAKRAANAAIARLMLGEPTPARQLMVATPDPRARSYLIVRLGRVQANPAWLVGRMRVVADRTGRPVGVAEKDVVVLRSALQALGGYRPGFLLPDSQPGLIDAVREYGLTADDPGLHASAAWLLGVWGKRDVVAAETDRRAADPAGRTAAERRACDDPDRRWFVNSNRHEMVTVPGPVTFLAGSPKGDPDRADTEVQRERRVGRSFAVASTLTTLSQFARFEAGVPKDKQHVPSLPEKFRERPDQPVVRANWYAAARYCNWLTLQDGLRADDCCYEEGAGGTMRAKRGCLDLPGYRLPTDAEMEYANRGGTATTRFYGETKELLGEYAWYARNTADKDATKPVGTRRPNDFGLFDVQGNAFTWCADVAPVVVSGKDDVPVVDPPTDRPDSRVLRGGAYYFVPESMRAAARSEDAPTTKGLYYSFRVAKTLK